MRERVLVVGDRDALLRRQRRPAVAGVLVRLTAGAGVRLVPRGPVRLPLAIARSRVRHGVLFHVCFEVRARVTRDFPPKAVAKPDVANDLAARAICRGIGRSDHRAGLRPGSSPRPLDRGATMSAATFQDLRYEIVDHVATITFARPDRLNAFRARHDARVPRRAGSRRRRRRGPRRGRDRRGPGVLRGRRHLRRRRARSNPPDTDEGGTGHRPATAAGSSRCGSTRCASRSSGRSTAPSVGMGATMTLPMDVRLASVDARFGFPFTRRGIIPEGCSSWFLPRVVGIGTASEWMLTGRIVDALEALAAGLVRSVHAPDELLPAAYAARPRDQRQRGAGVGRDDPSAALRGCSVRRIRWTRTSPSPRGLASARAPTTRAKGSNRSSRSDRPSSPARVSTDYVDMFDD